ncbi:MAG: HDOD domain-containing protein [Rhodoferax sp.]|uniref:HDOD domain-containing protein n=1 Tax=Rhodoferax sp. TaxID=50421 RepID=UPI00260789FF|nr:HDOD domain-containing protein [Rhodoferax sp.]MDD2880930.1 HDOD domain-containing protein [Rhodoferax sp.]
MAAGVLHDVSLGYQLLWNAQRQLAGVELTLAARPGCTLNAGHLLTTLSELWGPQAPTFYLRSPSPQLLVNLLDLTPPALTQIEVQADLLNDPAIAQRVQRAQQRGLQLVWRGESEQPLMPAFAASFGHGVVNLSTDDALMALRVSRQLHASSKQPGLHAASPVRAGQIYDGVASRALAEHCLDEQAAAALLGWPVDDVLYSHRQARVQPSQLTIRRLIKAIEVEASMDDLERLLGDEPLLAYHFLRYTNSAGLGLRHEIDALRQGLLVLGLSRTRTWLLEQLAHATQDLNLQPVRQSMVLRASLMAELLDAGESEALKRELYLCGLLSQIDVLLGEPMTSALRAIHLPSRVKEALLSQSGPYWPYLDLAMGVEAPFLETTRERCSHHGFDPEDVNLALLRTLAALK